MSVRCASCVSSTLVSCTEKRSEYEIIIKNRESQGSQLHSTKTSYSEVDMDVIIAEQTNLISIFYSLLSAFNYQTNFQTRTRTRWNSAKCYKSSVLSRCLLILARHLREDICLLEDILTEMNVNRM